MSDLSDLSQCPLSRESTEVVPVAWESARLHTPDQDEEQSDHPHRHAISVPGQEEVAELTPAGGLFRAHPGHVQCKVKERKLEAFQDGVSCCVTMYRESFDEVASMLQTFGGSATARIDLSIMVDGHSTPEACEHSETFRALQECLVDKSTVTATDTGSYSEYGCRVMAGKLQDVPWRIHLKGPSCARGQHNSHKKWYEVLDGRIREGLAHYPTGMMHMDADSYMPEGVIDIERLLIMLVENPQVACVSPRIRMANPWDNFVTIFQVFDFSLITMFFSMQSAFRAVQVNMGVLFMERTELFTLRVPGKTAVMDDYCHYKVESFWDVCSTVGQNQDVWLAYFNVKAGFGTMLVSSVHCYTTIPDTWAEMVGQRRRWFGGLFMSLYMFFGFSSINNFIWSRWARILMWLFFCVPTLLTYYCGVGLVVNGIAKLWAQRVILADPALIPLYLDPATNIACGQTVFWVSWVCMLVFVIAVTDRQTTDTHTKQLFTVLPYVIMGGMLVRLFFTLHQAIQLDLLNDYMAAVGVNYYVQWFQHVDPYQAAAFSVVAPGVNFTGSVSEGVSHTNLLATLFTMLAQPLIPHLLINGPGFWPTLVCSFLVTLVTGTLVSPGIIYPLVMLFGIATIDSTAWGTRGVETAVAARAKNEIGMRKTKKYVTLVLFLAVSFFVSYMSFFHEAEFGYYYYWPVNYVQGWVGSTLFALGFYTQAWGIAARSTQILCTAALLWNQCECYYYTHFSGHCNHGHNKYYNNRADEQRP